MTSDQPRAPAAPANEPAAASRSARPWAKPLPAVRLAAGAADDPIATLEKLAKRGKLAGFHRDAQEPNVFTVAAFGNLYDRTMRGELRDTDASGRKIVFTTSLKRLFPVAVVVVLVLTLYPGVLLTDSLINMWFPAYPDSLWVTVAWYVPLTLLAVPALWKQFKASERASRQHAEETIAKIAGAVGGEVHSPATGPAAASGSSKQ